MINNYKTNHDAKHDIAQRVNKSETKISDLGGKEKTLRPKRSISRSSCKSLIRENNHKNKSNDYLRKSPKYSKERVERHSRHYERRRSSVDDWETKRKKERSLSNYSEKRKRSLSSKVRSDKHGKRRNYSKSPRHHSRRREYSNGRKRRYSSRDRKSSLSYNRKYEHSSHGKRTSINRSYKSSRRTPMPLCESRRNESYRKETRSPERRISPYHRGRDLASYDKNSKDNYSRSRQQLYLNTRRSPTPHMGRQAAPVTRHAKRQTVESDENDQSNSESDEEDLPEDQLIAKLLGVNEFSTSKNKDHSSSDLSHVKKKSKRQYRQYMNRRGGFNRPLSPVF